MRGIMKNNSNSTNPDNTPVHDIPDIDIIDLENSGDEGFPAQAAQLAPDEDMVFSEEDGLDFLEDEEFSPKRNRKSGRSFKIVHILFFVCIFAVIALVIYRVRNWGVHVDLDEIFKDGPGTYDNTYDTVLPLMDQKGNIVQVEDKAPVIVAFGNAPFADDRDSEDNLCNIIEDMTGATVYNCSVSNSFLAQQSWLFDVEIEPMDAYCFYWLVTLATGGPIEPFFEQAEEALGDKLPPEAKEVYETLTTLDFNTVDVVVVMYDATDYLMGHEMYSDQNYTEPTQFTGNLEAGIELLQNTYPHIRIIVMSPTYAYAVDTEGNYVSSDMYTYGQDVLSTYAIMEWASCSRRSVSFIDHLYGTITEDNAKEYLTDNLHLNVKGRELVAKRFEYFLNYYSKGYGQSE